MAFVAFKREDDNTFTLAVTTVKNYVEPLVDYFETYQKHYPNRIPKYASAVNSFLGHFVQYTKNMVNAPEPRRWNIYTIVFTGGKPYHRRYTLSPSTLTLENALFYEARHINNRMEDEMRLLTSESIDEIIFDIEASYDLGDWEK